MQFSRLYRDQLTEDVNALLENQGRSEGVQVESSSAHGDQASTLPITRDVLRAGEENEAEVAAETDAMETDGDDDGDSDSDGDRQSGLVQRRQKGRHLRHSVSSSGNSRGSTGLVTAGRLQDHPPHHPNEESPPILASVSLPCLLTSDVMTAVPSGASRKGRFAGLRANGGTKRKSIGDAHGELRRAGDSSPKRIRILRDKPSSAPGISRQKESDAPTAAAPSRRRTVTPPPLFETAPSTLEGTSEQLTVAYAPGGTEAAVESSATRAGSSSSTSNVFTPTDIFARLSRFVQR